MVTYEYEKITLGELDVEFNNINFGCVCDGDNQIIKCGMIEDEEINTKR